MKIAITSQGPELSSPYDQRFGRTKWLIIVDTETGEHNAVNNNMNLNAPTGAGIQTAQNVSNLGVSAVVTANLGPKAFTTLSAANIKVYLTKASTAGEALDLFKEGKIEQVTQANAESHWI